jgi:hypothetical protein
MVQLQTRLATTTEDSNKTITEQLQKFSQHTLDPIHIPGTDEVTYEFEVASDEVIKRSEINVKHGQPRQIPRS